MNKKLILTESQYDKLSQFIFETRFDKVLQNSINVGDVIRIEFKNSTSNFKVIDSSNGQIIMDNIDSGSTNINYRYFMSPISFEGNKLEVRRINKIKDKAKLGDIKSWQVIPVNDIKKIDVIRNGSVIDSVDEPKPSSPKEKQKTEPKPRMTTNDYNDLEAIKDELLSLQEYHMVTFDLVDGTKINFCATAKNGLTYELEVASIDGDKAKYENLRANRVQMHFNESIEQDYLDDILAKKGNDITLLLKIIKGEELTRYNLIFNKVKVGGPCSEEGKLEDTEEDDMAEAKKAMHDILNDPNLKKAFYTQPTLWNLFVAELKNRKATGKGILTTKNIVNNYKIKKYTKKLGESANNFKIDRQAKFKLSKPITINYFTNSKKLSQDFGIVNPYIGTVTNGETSFELVNKVAGWKVVINSTVNGEQDTYMVDVYKIKITKDGEFKTLGKEDNVKILMLESPGYNIKIK